MTRTGGEHVTLVVDPEFGNRAKDVAALGPLWVIASPPNTAAIKELRASGIRYDANSPTYFKAAPGGSTEDSAIQGVWSANDHHPNWSAIEIVGMSSSERLIDALKQCADGTATATATGFIFSRLTNPHQESK